MKIRMISLKKFVIQERKLKLCKWKIITKTYLIKTFIFHLSHFKQVRRQPHRTSARRCLNPNAQWRYSSPFSSRNFRPEEEINVQKSNPQQIIHPKLLVFCPTGEDQVSGATRIIPKLVLDHPPSLRLPLRYDHFFFEGAWLMLTG